MDRLLILTQVALGVFGVLGVAASQGTWLEHGFRVVVGLAVTFAVARLSPKAIVRFSPIAYISVLLLLVAVLFIGVSPEGMTAKRWILIGGFTLQPSELMKVTVIAYLAAFFYNHLGNWQLWRPVLVMGLAAGAIVVEPDISTALFIFVLAFTVMLAAGTSLVRLISIGTVAALIAILVAGSYISQLPYLQARLMSYVNVILGTETVEETREIGFQASQARRTLVRAGFFGVGPGRPFSVPEADTDMIAIAIGHSLGLVGIMSLFVFYFLIASRGIKIAASLSGPGALLAAGATAYICGQAALNLLVASGLFPITGIPLPFVSYGLNSLISVGIAMGFIHSAYRQARLEGMVL